MKDEKISENALLKFAAEGNKEAYQEVVTKYKSMAYYVALGFVKNAQDALDISQEAFIRAFYQIKKFDVSKAFYPWFYKILKNICLDHLKRRNFPNEIPIERIAFFEDETKNLELRDCLWKEMERLPLVQREVIILRYFRQCSYKEIAEMIQIPVGTVMSSLYYAKKKLRKMLVPYLTDKKGTEPEK